MTQIARHVFAIALAVVITMATFHEITRVPLAPAPAATLVA